MNQHTETLFKESQRMTQLWIWLFVGGISGLAWWGFYQQIILGQEFGNDPAPDWIMWLLVMAFGILFPVFIYSCCLHTQVRRDGLYYRFNPLHFRWHSIPIHEIESCEAVKYHPILDYGGWGIRYGPKGKAYNVSGNRGLKVNLKSGKSVLFGSKKSDEMKLAVDSLFFPPS